MNFKWTNRYSDTEKPDKQGRWARLCWCNGFLIATIYLEFEAEEFYVLRYEYPARHGYNIQNYDLIERDKFNEAKAKAKVEQSFKTFIEQVTK